MATEVASYTTWIADRLCSSRLTPKASASIYSKFIRAIYLKGGLNFSEQVCT